MVTEEGVGMIHLTLVQDAKEKGRISVHLNTQELGTVSVEAKVGSDSAELYGISDTSADKLSEKLEQALKQLPVELCEVLTLYYFQELKLTEISDTLQIGLPLVKYRLRKAKIQLEEVLRKEEYDEFGRKNENV